MDWLANQPSRLQIWGTDASRRNAARVFIYTDRTCYLHSTSKCADIKGDNAGGCVTAKAGPKIKGRVAGRASWVLLTASLTIRPALVCFALPLPSSG